jgi:adenosylcobinamide kinase/adenosylcobinamide-phosphate guanylyltransferase
MLTLILGGARSGKSRLAQRLAEPAGRVTYIATAEAGDDPEMAARIARHRADRPGGWHTVEEPLALAGVVEQAADGSEAILVDCLTIWLSNLFWEHHEAAHGTVEDTGSNDAPRRAEARRQSGSFDPTGGMRSTSRVRSRQAKPPVLPFFSSDRVEDVVRAELARVAAAARRCHVILVSNELGCGTVPEPVVTRAFRDTQGLLNQWAAELADEVILTVAGLPLYLKGARR